MPIISQPYPQNRCPVCQQVPVHSSKTMSSHSTCANDHHWHFERYVIKETAANGKAKVVEKGWRIVVD